MTTIICNIEKLIVRIKNEIDHKNRRSRTGNDFGFGENSAVDGEIWLNEYISTISSDIFSKLFSPMSRSLENPEEAFINGIEYGGNDIIYNVDFPTTIYDTTTDPSVSKAVSGFDINTLPSITRALEDTIVSFAVSEWLKDLRIPGWEREELDHINKYDNLRNLTVRRIHLKRTYKLY